MVITKKIRISNVIQTEKVVSMNLEIYMYICVCECELTYICTYAYIHTYINNTNINEK